MTKRLDGDSIHPSETAYDKAIKRMEEWEARILEQSNNAGGCQSCRTNKSTAGTAYSNIASCHATIS